MTALALVDAAVIARLQAAGVETFDKAPDTTPAGRYCVLYPTTGRQPLVRLSASPVRTRWSARLVFVARTRDGLRAAVRDGRAALTGWRPAADVDPLQELDAGPELSSGPAGDIRLSMTLAYFAYTQE